MLEKYKVLRTAEKFVIEKKYPQAIQQYEKLAQQEGDDPTLLNTIGDLLIRVQNKGKALQYFRKVASIYMNSGFIVRAIATYKKIHHLDPGDPQINETLAELFEKQGLNQDARRHLRVLLDQYQSTGEGLKSLQCLEKMVELDPANNPDRIQLAKRLKDEGEQEAASQHFLAAALSFSQAGDADQAMEMIRESVDLNPDAPVLEAFVDIGEQASQLEEVEKFLEERQVAEGRETPYLYYTALVAEKKGENRKAHQIYRDLLEEGEIDPAVSDGLRRTEAGAAVEESKTAETELGERVDDMPEVKLETVFPESPPEATTFEIGESEGFEVESTDWEPEDEAPDHGDQLSSGLFDELPAEPLPAVPEPVELEQQTESSSVTISSLEEALEEADFYLKLGFQDEARRVLEVLLREHPEDERVQRRAKKVMTIPRTTAREAGEAEEAEAKVSFDEEIDDALDALFEGVDDEGPDEILRYDVQKSSEAKEENNPKVHYDLGLAYKEMGLVEDAVQEFLSAVELLNAPQQNPQKILCCSMLASSYLQMGDYDEAIEWARKGLTIPDMKDFEWKALQYDLGCSFQSKGDSSSALESFEAIAERDEKYRDIQEKITSLSE